MMTSSRRKRTVVGLIWLVLLLCLVSRPAGAQDETPTEEPASEETPAAAQSDSAVPSYLLITDKDESSVPTVGLRVAGINSGGGALNPELNAFTIRHNGEVVIPDETRSEAVGTLTIFLLDLTSGVEDQLPAVQALIEGYASPDFMTETVDYVAIYRTTEESPVQLLAPESFHNGVANHFTVTPLEAQSGPTALIDSLSSLLGQINELKPDPAMLASIFVISDGTDPLSTGDPADIAPLAAELGVPLHGVGVTNSNLSAELTASGHDYLATLGAGSRGTYSDVEDNAAVTTAYTQAASLSDHWWLLYTVPDAAGGTFPVEVSLLHEPEVTAETTVTVAGTTPSVSLNIPAESRQLSLPNLDAPVVLGFSATVTWLDGSQRTVQTAELLVNGETVGTIDPATLSGFESEIANLAYGANTVQIQIVDEQGLEARSPAVTLTIQEGPQEIPEELAPNTPWMQYVTYCLVGLLVVALIAGVVLFILERRGLLRASPRRAKPSVAPPPAPPPAPTPAARPAPATEMHMHQLQPVEPAAPAGPAAYLEVVHSESRMPTHIPLSGPQTRLGRSPQQAEIAFENDITVSRLHATITWDGDMYHIYDENSTSGTWVNDQQVIDYGLQLLDGDELYLGKVTLRFHLPG